MLVLHKQNQGLLWLLRLLFSGMPLACWRRGSLEGAWWSHPQVLLVLREDLFEMPENEFCFLDCVFFWEMGCVKDLANQKIRTSHSHIQVSEHKWGSRWRLTTDMATWHLSYNSLPRVPAWYRFLPGGDEVHCLS